MYRMVSALEYAFCPNLKMNGGVDDVKRYGHSRYYFICQSQVIEDFIFTKNRHCFSIMKQNAFDMMWLQDVLEIRPVFKTNLVYWSSEVNEVLADEAERNETNLSMLVLESLERFFVGDWGNVGPELKSDNDRSLRNHLEERDNNGLHASYSDTRYAIVINTDPHFSETVIGFDVKMTDEL